MPRSFFNPTASIDITVLPAADRFSVSKFPHKMPSPFTTSFEKLLSFRVIVSITSPDEITLMEKEIRPDTIYSVNIIITNDIPKNDGKIPDTKMKRGSPIGASLFHLSFRNGMIIPHLPNPDSANPHRCVYTS